MRSQNPNSSASTLLCDVRFPATSMSACKLIAAARLGRGNPARMGPSGMIKSAFMADVVEIATGFMSRRTALTLEARLRERFGGSRIYIPK